jgi:hypothetical protein
MSAGSKDVAVLTTLTSSTFTALVELYVVP